MGTDDESADVTRLSSETHDATQRRRSEEALRMSEESLRCLIDHSSDVITVIKGDGTILYQSPSTERILGYEPNELIGKNATDLIHPDDLPGVVRAVTERLQGSPDTSPIECRFRSRNGSWRIMESMAEANVDDSGVTLAVVTTRDISERRREEEALRGSEDRWQSEANHPDIASSLREVMWSASPSTLQTLYLSASAEVVYGRPVAEFFANASLWFEVIYPEDKERVARHVQTVRTDGLAELEYRILRPDGEVRWLHGRVRLRRDASGRVTQIVCNTTDMTDRRRAEEEVRLLLSITQAIDATDDFTSALDAVLREVCEATAWDYGESWLPYPDGTVLESSPAWHSSTDTLTRFRLVSEQTTFPPGAGLPGRVWLSKQPEWIEDLWTRPDTVFYRAAAAQEAGLKAGLGIPITANGEVLAVLAFFVSEPREEDRRLVELISAVAQQLGGLFQRKRAEAALRESEERYRIIVDNTNEVIYKVSLEDDPLRGSVEFVSGQVKSILGYAPDEFVQNPELWLQIIHPDDVPAVAEITREMHANREPGTGEYRVRHKETGEYRWVEDKMVPLTDGDGDMVAYQGVARDISERKRAEAALRESEGKLRAIIESSPDYIFMMDPAGTILFVNNVALDLRKEDVLGTSVYSYLPPEEAQVMKESCERVLRSKKPGSYEVKRQGPGDVPRSYESRVSPVLNGDRIIALAITSTDVTERKRAEAALRESDERYRALVESAFEGIVISRAEKILEANESFARMFGYELPEVIGLSPVGMTTPESAELISKNIQSGFEKPYEISGIKKDGTTISIEVIGKNCLYQGHEARITAFRDITEIKRAEEARQQARDELEGRVEHELLRRNPYGLTFRELTVLHLVAGGKPDKEIGIELGISPLTARKHLSNILTKMDAASRTEAVARGLREGLLD